MALAFTWKKGVSINRGSVQSLIATWTSSTGGAATATTSGLVSGRIVSILGDPSTSAQPTNNYDIVVTDSYGLDVLGACTTDATNLTNTGAVSRVMMLTTTGAAVPIGATVNDTLTVTVSNAGNAKAGAFVMYIAP